MTKNRNDLRAGLARVTGIPGWGWVLPAKSSGNDRPTIGHLPVHPSNTGKLAGGYRALVRISA